MPKLLLTITNGSIDYTPEAEDGIVWETERKGAPGKLTFTVVKDKTLNFQEGNKVTLSVDGKGVFCGFVFTKKRNKDGLISVTAYDQLRYLKNKTSYIYTNKTASQLLVMMAKDFGLELGEVEDTGYVIPNRDEDNQTLFDILGTVLDETLQHKKQMYVLYDNFGKLTLKNIGSLKLDLLLHAEGAENFDYQSSIDSNTYNQIVLGYDNQKTNRRDKYMARSGENINRWGLLQYYEKLNNPENGPAKADALLSLYNRKTRSLSISNAFGDVRVHGGCLLPVTLDLGDMVANTYMIADRVRHTFKGDSHFMDLTMIGGDFYA